MYRSEDTDFGKKTAHSLRPYYRDQVRRVAGYSALNLRLRDRLPGDEAMIGAKNGRGKRKLVEHLVEIDVPGVGCGNAS
jgi:hypothetical protein